jgi:hypothetical protein
LLAIVSAIVAMLAGIEAAWRAARGLPRGVPAERLEYLFVLAIVVSIAGGLGLVAGGTRPQELLHFVYAIVAVGALPIADSISRNASPRRQGIATLIGALVALAVIARLFGTG